MPARRSSSACATCRRSTNRAKPQAGRGSPEAPDQVVVAAAAADHVAERRVVDLEDRARVVAEVAHEAEVEDHAVGQPALRDAVGHLAEPLRRPAARRRRRARRRARSPRGPPRSCGSATSVSLPLAAHARARRPRAPPAPRSRGARAPAGPRPRRCRPAPIALEQAAVQARRRRGRCARAGSPAASSAAHSTSITSIVPPGASAPISSSPAWRNSRCWPRCGVTAR